MVRIYVVLVNDASLGIKNKFVNQVARYYFCIQF